MAIAFKKYRTAQNPMVRMMIAFERAENGKVFYAAEAVSDLFLRDVKEKFGSQSVIGFWRKVREQLSERVVRRERFLENDYDMIELPAPVYRTREETLAMLGVEESSWPAPFSS